MTYFMSLMIDFASYASDKALARAGDNIKDVILLLQDYTEKVFQQFFDNRMKESTDKFHLQIQLM